MFRFLASLIKFIFFIFLIALSYFTISDMFFNTDYFLIAEEYYGYLRIIGLFTTVYILIFIFSLIERIFKKSKNIKSKSKNGNIEVTLDTINAISVDFLQAKDIIKVAKVKSHAYFSKVIINVNVETYNEKNLNEKLDEIQKELKEYITLMTGVVVKQASIKITKILQENSIKTREIDEVDLKNLSDEEIVNSTPEF